MKSEMNKDTLKSIIEADRAALLKTIIKDISLISKDTASKFEENINKYDEIEVPSMPKKVKKKNFRKISAYLAFCKNLREKNRNSDGKLSVSVLDITRKSGDSWRKMTDSDKAAWKKVADNLTEESKKNFVEEKFEIDADKIKKMDKRALKKVASIKNIVLPINFTTEEIRNYISKKI